MLCDEHGWPVIVGVEPEDRSDIERLLALEPLRRRQCGGTQCRCLSPPLCARRTVDTVLMCYRH